MNDDNYPQTPSEANAAAPAKTGEPEAERPEGQWKMPEPVFRQTSGKLPAGFEKKVFNHEPSAESASPKPVSTPAVDIQPQPDVSEEFTLDEVFAEQRTEEPPKRRGVGIILAVVGIIGMIALAVLLLAIIYFLFFYQRNGINNLN